ncbi:hypothetical protein D3C77_726690 [compost metagenome]
MSSISSIIPDTKAGEQEFVAASTVSGFGRSIEAPNKTVAVKATSRLLFIPLPSFPINFNTLILSQLLGSTQA